MTTNIIACIVVLIIGIVLLLIGIYQLILSRKEELRALIGIPFLCVGIMFIILSIAHWNDDKEYKVIECTSYKIEVITIQTNDSITEEKYKIYYK